MSKPFKILAILAILFAIIVGVLFLAGRAIEGASAPVVDEAETFGATATQDECFREATTRALKCDGFICGGSVAVFETICLMEAKPTEGFCDGVPDPLDAAASKPWYDATCPELGLPDHDTCEFVQGPRQAICHDPNVQRQSAERRAARETGE